MNKKSYRALLLTLMMVLANMGGLPVVFAESFDVQIQSPDESSEEYCGTYLISGYIGPGLSSANNLELYYKTGSATFDGSDLSGWTYITTISNIKDGKYKDWAYDWAVPASNNYTILAYGYVGDHPSSSVDWDLVEVEMVESCEPEPCTGEVSISSPEDGAELPCYEVLDDIININGDYSTTCCDGCPCTDDCDCEVLLEITGDNFYELLLDDSLELNDGSWSVNWNTSGVTCGTYDMTSKLYCDGRLLDTDTISIEIYGRDSIIEIDYPDGGTFDCDEYILINGTLCDCCNYADYIEVYVDSDLIANITSGFDDGVWETNWTTPSSSGSHTIYAKLFGEGEELDYDSTSIEVYCECPPCGDVEIDMTYPYTCGPCLCGPITFTGTLTGDIACVDEVDIYYMLEDECDNFSVDGIADYVTSKELDPQLMTDLSALYLENTCPHGLIYAISTDNIDACGNWEVTWNGSCDLMVPGLYKFVAVADIPVEIPRDLDCIVECPYPYDKEYACMNNYRTISIDDICELICDDTSIGGTIEVPYCCNAVECVTLYYYDDYQWNYLGTTDINWADCGCTCGCGCDPCVSACCDVKDGTWTFCLDPCDLPNGCVNITAEAVGACGPFNDTTTVLIGNGAEVEICEPDYCDLLCGMETISGEISMMCEPECGCDVPVNVYISADGINWTELSGVIITGTWTESEYYSCIDACVDTTYKSWEVCLPTCQYEDGCYYIKAAVTDSCGCDSYDEVCVKINNTVDIEIFSPEEGESWYCSTGGFYATVSTQCSDFDEGSIEVYLNGVKLDVCPCGPTIEYIDCDCCETPRTLELNGCCCECQKVYVWDLEECFEPCELEDGEYTIMVNASGPCGPVAECVTFTVDNSAELNILNCGCEEVCGIVNITGTASGCIQDGIDIYYGCGDEWIYIDTVYPVEGEIPQDCSCGCGGCIPIVVNNSGLYVWSVLWNTCDLPNGPYTILANATDICENNVKKEVCLYVDNSLPVLEITGPGCDESVCGLVTITGIGGNCNCANGLEFYYASKDTYPDLNDVPNEEWTQFAYIHLDPYDASNAWCELCDCEYDTHLWYANLTTCSLDDGYYWIRAEAIGDCGSLVNETDCIWVNKTIDLEMIVPGPGVSDFSGQEIIRGNSENSNCIDRIVLEYHLCDSDYDEWWSELGEATIDENGDWEYIWNTCEIQNGCYCVRAVAYGVCGNNATTDPAMVDVLNEDAVISIESPESDTETGLYGIIPIAGTLEGWKCVDEINVNARFVGDLGTTDDDGEWNFVGAIEPTGYDWSIGWNSYNETNGIWEIKADATGFESSYTDDSIYVLLNNSGDGIGAEPVYAYYAEGSEYIIVKFSEPVEIIDENAVDETFELLNGDFGTGAIMSVIDGNKVKIILGNDANIDYIGLYGYDEGASAIAPKAGQTNLYSNSDNAPVSGDFEDIAAGMVVVTDGTVFSVPTFVNTEMMLEKAGIEDGAFVQYLTGEWEDLADCGCEFRPLIGYLYENPEDGVYEMPVYTTRQGQLSEVRVEVANDYNLLALNNNLKENMFENADAGDWLWSLTKSSTSFMYVGSVFDSEGDLVGTYEMSSARFKTDGTYAEVSPYTAYWIPYAGTDGDTFYGLTMT
ncbi:hypothetical protein [Methanococcus sp. CF]